MAFRKAALSTRRSNGVTCLSPMSGITKRALTFSTVPFGTANGLHCPSSRSDWRVRLVFLGAADEAVVYVNGVRAGYHRGAYMPFALDVTELVQPGSENEVTVRLRRRVWGTVERHLLPPGDHDWWLYGGLFQSVYVEIVPELSVAAGILAGYRQGTMRSVVVLHNDSAADRRVIVRFDPGWEGQRTRSEENPASSLAVETTVPAGQTAAVSFELPAPADRLGALIVPIFSPRRPK